MASIHNFFKDISVNFFQVEYYVREVVTQFQLFKFSIVCGYVQNPAVYNLYQTAD